MADIPPGFDSDELVSSEDEAVLNPYLNVGKKMMEEMRIFAKEDRLASKKRMKNLRDLSGAPYQARQRQLWFNYFTTFVVDVLGQSMDVTPTGELLCRFTAHIIERLKSNIPGKPAYGKESLKSGLRKLKKRLVFEYSDFRLTPHHTSRIDALFDALTKERKLTVGKWRKSQWIGFLTLRSIMTSYINDALSNGVSSWDVRISRWLAIVLQSSADSRAGEIVRSNGYKGREFMSWEDVEIKLVGGTQFEYLQAQATLRWEKNTKGDPTTYRKVRWRPLERFGSAVIDPIVLLLVHAMRNGQARGHTIEAVLQQIVAEPSKTLVWANPTWPIIPAIKNNANGLDFTQPAHVGQLHSSLVEAGRLHGMTKDLWLHDLRRGCAQDLTRVKHVDAGVDARVAAALGHSMTTFHQGTTARYTERVSMFLPNAREQLDEDPFGPKIAAVPYKKPKRLAKHVLDEASRKYPGLSRRQVAARVHKELKREWEEEAVSGVAPQKRQRGSAQEEGLSASTAELGLPISSPLALSIPSTTQASLKMPTPASTATITEPKLASSDNSFYSNIDPKLLFMDDNDEAHRLLQIMRDASRRLFQITSSTKPADGDDPLVTENGRQKEDDDDEEAANRLLQMIRGAKPTEGDDALITEDGRQTDDIEDELIIEALIQDEQEGPEPLQLPVMQFINFFASINTVLKSKKYSPEQLAALGHSVGSSRNPLEQFTKKCVHQELGCNFEHYDMTDLEIHESQKCPYREYASPEQILKRKAPREWKCSRCDKSFLRKRFLRKHEKYAHMNGFDGVGAWEPKACDKGCTTGHVFTTEQRYKDHVATKHPQNPSFVPQKCALKDICRLEKDFTSTKQYKSHLSHVHRLDKEQSQAYLPAKRASTPYKEQPCPLGGCSLFEKDIPDRTHLVRHLTGREHKLSEHKAKQMAGWSVEEGDSTDDDGDTVVQLVQPREAPVVFPCPIGKCNYAHKSFPDSKSLKRHLKSGQHKCSDEEANRLSGVSTSWNKEQRK